MDVKFLLNSDADRPCLRVGLLMDGVRAPRWIAEAIGHMLGSNFVTICVVVLNDFAIAEATEQAAGRSWSRRLLDLVVNPDRCRNVLFGLYERWDSRNRDPATDPLRPVDCSDLLAGVKKFRVKPLVARFVHRFRKEDLLTIQNENLDVLVRFGFNILRGDVLSAARYGCWSYHHGDSEFFRGGPAYFWELVEEKECSGAILQVLSERLDDGRILCKGTFATELGISLARNRVRPYWGAVSFLIQKLRELHQHGWGQLQSEIVPTPAYQGRKEIYRVPTNAELGLWIARRIVRSAFRRIARRPRTMIWRLGIRKTDTPLIEGGQGPDLKQFQWIESPRGHYFADPFIAQAGSRRWVFFENYDYERQIGRICCAELLGVGLVHYGEVLNCPYHLSYPCIFRDADTWYMIPETYSSRCVELYAARQFPGGWQLVRRLMEADAVDSTLWIEGGLYWLFVTRVERRGNATQLWLYSASSLEGEWVPHPANPLSTDVRNSRGAGAIFRHGGRLYRPSQEGTIRYGRRLVLNEILELSARTYRERIAVEIEPNASDGLFGVHSYALSGNSEIIDGLMAVGSRIGNS